MTSLSAFLLIQILGTVLCAQDWAYEEGIDGALGPQEWKNGYKLCGRRTQAPVNIIKKEAARNAAYRDHTFKSVDTKFSNANLTNNGLYLSLKSDDMSSITFAVDYNLFQLAEIRFHWGQNDSVGSEYTFDGKSYPLEMQLIFFSSTVFDSFKESLENGYGLYIVAMEFEIASEDNEVISDVVDALESIQEVGTTKVIGKMKSSLRQVLPTNRNHFYLYGGGSLTSPPCTYAEWLIYMNPQTISSNQVEKFRQLNAKYGGKLTNNDRPIQPLIVDYLFYNNYVSS